MSCIKPMNNQTWSFIHNNRSTRSTRDSQLW